MSSDVLVVTPVMKESSGRARLYTKAFASIMNIRYPKQLDHYMSNGGDDAQGMPNVVRKYQDARDVLLAGKWQYMMCCEYDNIIPPNALEKLMALDSDIAYGLYCLRHNKRQWTAMLEMTDTNFVSLSDKPDEARKAWGNVIDVAGVGQGCTLIKRHVIEAFPFWAWGGTSCDWPLALDVKRAGMTQRCDLSVLSGHISILPSPQILWPDINEPDLCRIESLVA